MLGIQGMNYRDVRYTNFLVGLNNMTTAELFAELLVKFDVYGTDAETKFRMFQHLRECGNIAFDNIWLFVAVLLVLKRRDEAERCLVPLCPEASAREACVDSLHGALVEANML